MVSPSRQHDLLRGLDVSREEGVDPRHLRRVGAARDELGKGRAEAAAPGRQLRVVQRVVGHEEHARTLARKEDGRRLAVADTGPAGAGARHDRDLAAQPFTHRV
jgi:hypothetical protein